MEESNEIYNSIMKNLYKDNEGDKDIIKGDGRNTVNPVNKLLKKYDTPPTFLGNNKKPKMI